MNFNSHDFQVIENKSNVLAAILDDKGNFIKFNDKWCSLLDTTSEILLGKNLFNYVLEQDRESLKTRFNEALTSDQSQIIEVGILAQPLKLHPMRAEIFSNEGLIFFRCLDATKTNLWNSVMTDVSTFGKICPWYHDVINNVTTWSKESYDLFDMRIEEELTPDTFLEFFNFKDQEELRDQANFLREHHLPYTFLGKATTRKGQTKWIKTVAEPVVHENTLVFIKGLNIDISEEYDLTEELARKNRIQRLALKGIKSGLFHHDLISDEVTYSNEFRKMIGFTDFEKPLLEPEFRTTIVDEDRDEAFSRHSEELRKASSYYSNQYRLKHKDGAVQHYEVHAWKQRNAKGQLTEMVGNLINVEQRVIAEQKVKEHINRLESIIENAFIYTVILDLDRTILSADNRSYNYMLHEFGADIKSEKVPFEDVVPENFRASFIQEFNKVLNGERLIKEIDTVLFSGKSTALGMEYKPLFDSEGVVYNVVIYFIDRSGKRKAELMYERANFKFEQIEILKRNILTGLSHEIKVPLNGIQGSTQLLLRENLNENQKDVLHLLQESAKQLDETVNKITNLSLINYEQNTYPLEVLDLKEVAEESYKRLLHMANKKKLILTINSFEEPLQIRANSRMLGIVLDNLINNAIKYTDEGHVVIKITKEAHSQIANITISDSGIGISHDNLQRIFLDFEQESFGLERKYEGTGIGLSISKKYLTSIGGNLSVHSQLHKGSTFIVTLPMI
ncbi:MAG: ATP-binding protein [Flavobacteriales bacterium]